MSKASPKRAVLPAQGTREPIVGAAAAHVAPLPAPVSVQRVELECHRLRILLDAAAETLSAYEGEITPIRDRYAPLIRRHGDEIKREKEALQALLGGAPANLFGKVKSRVIHAIKVGWRKSPDVWGWPEEAALVALIEERCSAEQQADYLQTTTVGKKDAIPDEVRRELLGIGCTRGRDAAFVNETAPSTGEALLALLGQLPADAGAASAGQGDAA